MSLLDSIISVLVVAISIYMGLVGSAGFLRVALKKLQLSGQDKDFFSEEYSRRHEIIIAKIFRNERFMSFVTIGFIFMYNPLPVLFFFVPVISTSAITTFTILLARYNRSFFGRLINFKSN